MRSDRPAEGEAQGSVPGFERRERSTPTAEGVPGGRRAYHSNRRTCPGGEGLVTPTLWTGPRKKDLSLQPSASAACEGLGHSALAASLVGDLFGASRAEGTTPRFLGRETLEKPDNASIITSSATARKGLGRPIARIVHLSSQHVSKVMAPIGV